MFFPTVDKREIDSNLLRYQDRVRRLLHQVAGDRDLRFRLKRSTKHFHDYQIGRTIDLVIGSVGNYLMRHDWQRGEPVLAAATVTPEARDGALRRLDGGISERRPSAAWQLDGVTLRDAPQETTGSDPVGLLLLEEGGIDITASS